MSIHRAAKLWDVPPESLRKWISGGMPGVDRAAQLAQGAGVSLDWLVGGEHPSIETSSQHWCHIKEYHPQENGFWVFPRSFMDIHHLNPDDMVMLKNQGDAMEPYIQDGAAIMVDTTSQTEPSADVPCALVYRGTMYIKYVHLHHHSIDLISSKKGYPPIKIKGLDIKSMEIIGRVVWSCRIWPAS
ncbi:hypothetical protein NQX30_04715 [Candidatus Persebacteraceae bacterium Df01]|jgi:hypothetical protein|uniref:Peptidase S24/S26A/S26B/S26C domain-containing protein n=1 Tax=Candidatus Doriopsillibacter californiensis TaxID=2970740 RepID=A0ABT7QLR6_9GAMM|nr:hypothetical protein [Candidatus Persebacteraceae bacterium Df01]